MSRVINLDSYWTAEVCVTLGGVKSSEPHWLFCALRWSDNEGLCLPALSLLGWEGAERIRTMLKRRKQRLGAPSLRIQ